MLVLEQLSVMNDLKGTRACRKKAVKHYCGDKVPVPPQGIIHNNSSLSTAGTKVPTQLEEGMMTLLTSIN